MKKALLAECLNKSGLFFVMSKMARWSGLLVLNYHRIGEGKDSVFDKGLWSANAESFAEQVQYCKLHFDMIVPGDLPSVLATRRGQYGMITFDDGYRDNYDIAFPILKAAGVPAVFFVTTGFVDAPRVPWWDEIAWMVRTSRMKRLEIPDWLSVPIILLDEAAREQGIQVLLRLYKSIQGTQTERYLDSIADAAKTGRCGREMGKDLWMNWDMLREMKSAGMTIGGHSVSHQILSRLSSEQQHDEVQGCARRLVEEMQTPMHCFSYPVGSLQSFDDITRSCLREAGVRYAFSYYGGFRCFNDWNDYDIRRKAIESYLTPDWFKLITAMPQWFAA